MSGVTKKEEDPSLEEEDLDGDGLDDECSGTGTPVMVKVTNIQGSDTASHLLHDKVFALQQQLAEAAVHNEMEGLRKKVRKQTGDFGGGDFGGEDVSEKRSSIAAFRNFGASDSLARKLVGNGFGSPEDIEFLDNDKVCVLMAKLDLSLGEEANFKRIFGRKPSKSQKQNKRNSLMKSFIAAGLKESTARALIENGFESVQEVLNLSIQKRRHILGKMALNASQTIDFEQVFLEDDEEKQPGAPSEQTHEHSDKFKEAFDSFDSKLSLDWERVENGSFYIIESADVGYWHSKVGKVEATFPHNPSGDVANMILQIFASGDWERGDRKVTEYESVNIGEQATLERKIVVPAFSIFNAREFVLAYCWREISNGYEIAVVSVDDDRYPEAKPLDGLWGIGSSMGLVSEVVRARTFNTYRIERMDSGAAKLTGVFFVDLGGSVPIALQNYCIAIAASFCKRIKKYVTGDISDPESILTKIRNRKYEDGGWFAKNVVE